MQNSRDGLGRWLFLGLATYLVLELVPFLIAALATKKTAAELSGSYFAFAMPAVIFLPLVWWLRLREKQGSSSKLLAHGWALSGALSCAATIVAVIYSGMKFQLIGPNLSVGGLVFSAVLGVPTVYFTMYYVALTRISTRTATKAGAAEIKK